MAEVEERQVEEVDDEEEFALPEMAPDPKHDEAEGQEIMLHNGQQMDLQRERQSDNTRMKCDPTLAALVTKCLSALQRYRR